MVAAVQETEWQPNGALGGTAGPGEEQWSKIFENRQHNCEENLLLKWDVGAENTQSDSIVSQIRKPGIWRSVKATQIIIGGGAKEPMTSLCRIYVFCVGEIITEIWNKAPFENYKEIVYEKAKGF